jgi:hypothetical protein
LTVSASLEARRQAIAAALREVAAEGAPEGARRPSRDIATERRLDELSTRLGVVEMMLLEDAWERGPVPSGGEQPEDDAPHVDAGVPVSVPAVPLGEGRMSSVASRVLFGH